LRHYKDLPPAEQERELQNDPAFRRLTPERQQQLRQRLQHFSNLPPQQQLRMLNRMDTWEHLTPQQKQEARQIYGQMRQLPPDRQRMVTTAVRNLRGMPPDQQEKVINSDRFKGMFSDQEREMMRGATRLPLAPAEGAENEAQH
jgi:flagellar motor switch protein FliG